MRFSDFPFLRYFPFLVLGILAGGMIHVTIILPLIFLFLFWCSYALIVVNFIKEVSGFYRGLLAYSMLFCFGFILSTYHQKNDAIEVWENKEDYLAEVTIYDQTKPNSFENLLEIKSVNNNGIWEKSEGKILIYHQMNFSLEPGMILWVQGIPELIDPPFNPYEFDYSKFLKRKGISYRQFVGNKMLLLGKNKNSGQIYFLEHLRKKIGDILREKIQDPESNQVAQALLLGQKQYLDEDIKKAYSQSGVMHILAVSGLHVGIIYALLMFLVKPFGLKKLGWKSYLALVILIIWAYAMLTGFSPSVVRAATMFSLITLGQMRKRKPSVFNILAFSAMLMVTVNPEVIFDVGFQLSYLAVFGIVLIQPIIVNFWLPPNKFLEYFWQIIGVSLAAQLATLPLTIFYFHSFPTYFLLGNIFIIPLAFLIMQTGVPLLIFGWIPYVGDYLGTLVSKLIWIQNQLINQIQVLPNANLDRLTISPFTMIFIWSLLLIWVAWEQGNKRKLAWLVLSLAFIWSGVRVSHLFKSYQHEVIVYQSKEGILFDHAYYGEIRSWNNGVPSKDISFKIDPFRIQQNWPRIPETLFSIPVNDSTFYFPLENMEINNSEKVLVFHQEIPKSIRFWKNGRWVKNSKNSVIPFGEYPIQILF
ncbi:ComEC/Rec2 family competence protein [Algoriphagus sp. SE2]|uniref:ComEC/Rec2 family competence protein n=1 Tax=Algoriphagus sp. SE2 TaxID=3141536 RepID=UPI0031CD5D54